MTDFAELSFSESEFLSLRVLGEVIVAEVINVSLIDWVNGMASCRSRGHRFRLTFSGVTRSQREVHPYAVSTMVGEFLPTEYVSDVPERPPVQGTREFPMEGILLERPAWMSWDVFATACAIEELAPPTHDRSAGDV